MRARIAASIVLAAGVVLGTSGCSLFADQSTTMHYDASDGVSTNVGSLDVRNAIVISDNGETGNLVVTIVNNDNDRHILTVDWDSGSSRVPVDANSITKVGVPDSVSVIMDNIRTQPGAVMPIYFQYGEATGKELLVPVLTNQLPEYADLAPAEVEQ